MHVEPTVANEWTAPERRCFAASDIFAENDCSKNDQEWGSDLKSGDYLRIDIKFRKNYVYTQ